MTDDQTDIDETTGVALSHNDRNSAVWAKVRKYIEEKQRALRLKNETTDLDLVATAKVRGELKAYRNLLALGTPDQAMVADD